MMITAIINILTNINEKEVLRNAFSTNDLLSWKEIAKQIKLVWENTLFSKIQTNNLFGIIDLLVWSFIFPEPLSSFKASLKHSS